LKQLSPLLLCVMFSVRLQGVPGQLPVALNAAGTFSVLASSTVTNTGPSAITGDVGVSPGTAVTGFPPGAVVGGMIHAADGAAGAAQSALTSAYNDAAGRTGAASVSGDLGGLTLTPGLYQSTSFLNLTGALRLDGQGNTNSVFIFQIASALTTFSGSQVILQNGAQAANIFWQVGSSATLGTNSIFNGTIMALASVTLTTGAALNGRALALTGAVTLDTNTIGNPGPPTTGTPGALTVACPLSAAQVTVVYNSLLVATGGTPPYTFSITGSLPAGLNLTPSTGAVTGSPTGVGGVAFVVNVLDSVASNAARSCSITSSAAPPPATPAPSSLILVLIGFAGIVLYRSREKVLRFVRRG
jgi:hypothetical protein